ncbi:hypothetical protein ACTWP5_30925 [Streptomyces sp. 4N509B]|uniref:hypothetical protein n=1 Tax=Streptomyces sp. 4N509B TaxID=3457413 RepID=UPI003FD079C2
MPDNRPILRTILGEKKIVLLNRVTALAEMPEETFRGIVMAEAKSQADPITSLALRHPDLRVRWLKAIKAHITELDRQFAQRKDDPATNEWRRRANTVRGSLLNRKYEAEAANPRNRHIGETPEQRERRLDESAAERRRRGEIGELAIQRLREAHPDEFDAYLAEEYHKAGIELPSPLARRIASRLDPQQ